MKYSPLYYLKRTSLYRWIFGFCQKILQGCFLLQRPKKDSSSSKTSSLTFFETAKQFYHNPWMVINYYIDVGLDKIFWFVDHYVRLLGPFFVIVVFVVLVIFIIVAYVIGIPYWYNRSPLVLAIAFLIGHWLLLNVCWNYWQALWILPGAPSDYKSIIIPDSLKVSHCKKCNYRKPPRAHHCSVCNRCVLKMDHHCPWLNNCIGHYNHRYFILFCSYTWLGTVFIMLFGVFVLVDHFVPALSPFESDLFYQTTAEDNNNNYYYEEQTYSLLFGLVEIRSSKIRHKFIIFEAILAVLLFLLLGLLLRYHFSLITKGETCIERHINHRERERFRRQNRHYRNPYDFGWKENWRRFLFGYDRNRNNRRDNSWWEILLPSRFDPIGDGFNWTDAY